MSPTPFWSIDEQEWLASTDAMRLCVFLFYSRKGFEQRKNTLLYCACLRRIWHLLTDERCRQGVEAAEQHAEGLVDGERFMTFHRACCDGWAAMADAAHEGGYSTPLLAALADAGCAAYQAIDGDGQCVDNASSAAANFSCPTISGLRSGSRPAPDEEAAWNRAKEQEARAQIRLMHCIFGNPFRPVTVLDPNWLACNGGAARKLAQAIYDERAFDRLPFLADALEDAGCTNTDILEHSRGPGPHVPGCWVVDLLLEKK